MPFSSVMEEFPNTIQDVVRRIVQSTKPSKFSLFGSRARGHHRENSDFDFVVYAKSCPEEDWNKLLVNIESEPWTLHKIDLVEFETLSEDYKKNIKGEEKIVYEAD